MAHLRFVSLVAILGSSFATAQVEELPLSYFPSAVGNLWEYSTYTGLWDTLQTRNVSSYADGNGSIILLQMSTLINPPVYNPYVDSVVYKIDTLTTRVYGSIGGFRDACLFRLNAKPGDQWVMMKWAMGPYEICRVVESTPATLFGHSTTLMRMTHFAAGDSTDTLGLARSSITLAKGFGLVENIDLESGGGRSILGAVIDGVLFGDTTSVIAAVGDDAPRRIPSAHQLSYCYPNPFNSRTVVRYFIDAPSRVKLSVYDNLGREIRILFAGDVSIPGTYESVWDARTANGDFASTGSYFVRLSTTTGSFTRQVVLLK